MLEIAVILTAAALVYGVCRATRIPSIPLLVAVGVGLAATGAMPDREFVLDILEVGLAFLVFVAGMDMSPLRVRGQRSLALRVGLVQFVLLGLLAWFIAVGAGHSIDVALYVALAISASSTLVVVRLLKTRRELFESFGRMVLGVLLLQDMLVITGLVVLAVLGDEVVPLVEMGLELSTVAAIVGESPALWSNAVVVATGVLLALGSWLLGRGLLPTLIERYRDREETMLLLVLATLFGFSGLAWVGGVPIVVGAFCAGLALSSFPSHALVRALVNSLNDFFLVVFFIALGALFTIPSFDYFILGLILILLVLLATPFMVAVVAERAGMTARGALEAGLLIAQTSEFSLIIALYGWNSGLLEDDLFSMLLGVTVVTMTLTPLISSQRIVRWLMRWHPSPGPKTTVPDLHDHIVVIGGGTAGTLLVDRITAAGMDVVVVDNDPMVTIQFRERDCGAVWGDGEDEQTLREAGVDRARAVIVTTGDLHHLQRVMGLARPDAEVWLHAFESEQAEAARVLGAHTVTYSEAAAENFMGWFERRWADEGD